MRRTAEWFLLFGPPRLSLLAVLAAARFAEGRLRRSGRCHESEIRAALKAEVRRFRSPDSLSSAALKDMIRCAQGNMHMHTTPAAVVQGVLILTKRKAFSFQFK